MNDIEVTVRGNVSGPVERRVFADGSELTTFRMANNVRYQAQGEWRDGATNYFSVNCRRSLGANVMLSLEKGQPVIVYGRMRQHRWEKDGRNGEATIVEAFAVGHDLTRGSSTFSKINRVERVEVTEHETNDMLADQMIAEEDEKRARLAVDGAFLGEAEAAPVAV